MKAARKGLAVVAGVVVIEDDGPTRAAICAAVAGNPALALMGQAASAAVLGLMEWPQGYDLDGEIYFWSGIAFSMVALALFLRNALLSGLRHPVETALFVLLAVLATESLIALQISPTVGGLEFTAPLILVAIAAAFLSRNVRLFRSMEEYNLRLATELAAREQEIAESYAQRQEVARQQALLSERQRIMRDMHDGMGGRLMSIAAQLKAQGPAAPREQLAGELLEALDAFRARMEGKLAAAGIESEWTIDEDAAAPRYRPVPFSIFTASCRKPAPTCAAARRGSADRSALR
jgi:signal transduction histidine kinase